MMEEGLKRAVRERMMRMRMCSWRKRLKRSQRRRTTKTTRYSRHHNMLTTHRWMGAGDS
jgi:hypothetical protein